MLDKEQIELIDRLASAKVKFDKECPDYPKDAILNLLDYSLNYVICRPDGTLDRIPLNEHLSTKICDLDHTSKNN